MSLSRRKWITGGIAAAAGASGLTLAAKSSSLIPPDSAGVYGLGETLNYAAHRLTRHTLAREFPRSAISKEPFANEVSPVGREFRALAENGFADWRLELSGLFARPASLSLTDIKSYPSRSQITEVSCEEGWSYIAEWTGAPLAQVLETAGVDPKARHVVYYSIDGLWWDSIDIEEAMHPQTLVAYGMNGGELPEEFGGPLRLRVPRQLGYKSVKYIHRIVATDDIRKIGNGLGSGGPEAGYTWYAGI